MRNLLAKREKLILYITISVIGFSVIFNFAISPLLNKNEYLNKDINITREKLKRYILLLSQKDTIQNAYNKSLATFKAQAQREDTLTGTLSELGDLAKTAGVNIIEIKPQIPKDSALHYKEVFVDLRAEGTMEGYVKFIYNIEKSLSLLEIKRFQLNSKFNAQDLLEGNFLISKLSITE